MPRRKRRPDVVKLNVVQSVPGRRKKIRIEPLECPLAPLPSVRSETPGELVGHTDPGGSVCYDNDAQEEPLSHSEVQERSGTYKERKDKAAEAWADIRLKILPTIISGLGFKGSTCIFCETNLSCIWCPDCGSNAYLCEECAIQLHKNINLFHSPLLWMVTC